MLFWCIIISITSWLWKLTFLIICQKKFCFSMMMLKFYILLLIFSRSIILSNAIMRFMIRNSWLLFVFLKNDDLNWKTQFFLLIWLWIIKIFEYFITIKQFNYYQACWNEFLFCFNFKIMYYSEKADDKSDTLICWSEDFFKKRNNSDKCLLHQNQTVLKRYNFDDEVTQNFQNKIIIIQKLDLKIIFIFAHEIEFTVISVHCQLIKLQFLQLHLSSKKFFCFCINHLVSVFIEQENELDFLNNLKNESNESQLDIITDQLHSDENSTEISIQLLWNQVTKKD